MANSGSINGNFVSLGGASGANIRVAWQVASQNVSGNYSTINWQSYVDFVTADAQLDNGNVSSNVGTHYSNGGRVYNYAGNISTHTVTIGSGSFTITHNADGNQTLSMSGYIDVYGGGRTSTSGSWSLPSITRYSNITSFSSSSITYQSFTLNATCDLSASSIQFSIDGGANFASYGSGTSASNNFTGLAAGTTYTCYVRTVNATSGLIQTSDPLSVTTVARYSRIYTVLDKSAGGGSVGYINQIQSLTIASGGYARGFATYLTVYQALNQKEYEYRISTHTGAFIGVWQDVTSDFSYQQSLNQAPTEITVDIARSPNNLIVKYDALLDSGGGNITDTDGNIIYVAGQSANSVGTGTDVVENYNVDIYTFYGGYEQLLDTNGKTIFDTNGDPIVVLYGYPSGKRVYSGYIADYSLTYGENAGVSITVVPHVAETSHYLFNTSGGNTTVSYNSYDPVQMSRDAMDRYIAQGGNKITYSASSMPLSGQSISYDFKLQTVRESIDKSIDLLPAGYYQFVDPGENIQYLLTKGSVANHTFYYEQHITNMNLRKSLSQLVNDVYFVGGDTGGGSPLFKHYSDTTSINTYRPGLLRLSDSRVTLTSSAYALSNQQIQLYKSPRYRTSITITDAVYDIETIKLGQMVGFGNFGNFVDSLLLQIVTLHREKHKVTLDLDMIVPTDSKRLYELKKEMLAEQVRAIDVAPA